MEGQNLLLEVRLAAGRLEQLPSLATELAEARVEVIAAVSPPAIQAAKEATGTIPIVMAFSSVNPVHSRGTISGEFLAESVLVPADEIVEQKEPTALTIQRRADQVIE